MYCPYTSNFRIFPQAVFTDYWVFSSFNIKYFCFFSHTEAVMKATIDYEFQKSVSSCLLCYDLREICLTQVDSSTMAYHTKAQPKYFFIFTIGFLDSSTSFHLTRS